MRQMALTHLRDWGEVAQAGDVHPAFVEQHHGRKGCDRVAFVEPRTPPAAQR